MFNIQNKCDIQVIHIDFFIIIIKISNKYLILRFKLIINYSSYDIFDL